MSEIDDIKKALVETTTRKWYDDLLPNLRAAHTKYIPNPEIEDRFSMFLPPVDACDLQRIGKNGDGGKLICGLGKIPKSLAASGPKCTVYSLGSSGEFDFEIDLVREDFHSYVNIQ